MALSEGMRILAGHSAILILSFSAAPAEVGIYRVAAGIWTVATLPSTLIYVTCAPMLATLHEEGRAQAIQRLLSWMSLFLFVAAIAILAPFAIAGDWIVTMVFGSAYRASVPIILLLLSGELISATLGHSPTVLNMFKKEKVVARYSSLGLALNILLCMALAPRYGGFGVAAGAALGQIAWRALGNRYVRREMRLETSVLAWTTKRKGSRTCES